MAEEKELTGWRKTWANIRDWLTQWQYGFKWLRKKQMLARVAESAEGQRLLQLAKAYSIPIRVTMYRSNEKNSGQVDKKETDSTVGITVANNGDIVDMATTLHHELRHVEQQRAKGTVHKGFFGGLREAGKQYILSLMDEADAFTAEILEIYRREKSGQRDFIDNMLERNGKVTKHVAKLLKERPYESFESEAAFGRALFTHIMQGGLDHYSTDYFKDYASDFERAPTVEQFRGMVNASAEPPEDRPAESLLKQYGGNLGGAESFGALAKAFFKAQPAQVQSVLKLIENTVKNADTLTNRDYKQARSEIIKKSKKLSREFNKAGNRLAPSKHRMVELSHALKEKPILAAVKAA